MTAISYRLLLVPPRVVFAARCNELALPGTDAARVSYDRVSAGAYTDIRPDMLLAFGSTPGADDLGRARIRRPATGDTLYYGWASFGRGEGELHVQYDAYITVYDLYKPWTKTPRIDSNGVQFLDYDRDFATYRYGAPIVNLDCGTALQRALDPGTGLATFEFSAVNTYMTDPDTAAMYSAWAWELPAEATVTGGALDSHAITFTLPAGAWWVSAYETSSRGTVGTRRVLCVAGEPPGTLSRFDQLEITRRPEGQTLRVRVSEPVPASTYPNGCMAVLWKVQTEDGAPVTPSGLAGSENIAFVGWHYTDETDGRATERGFLDDTYLEFRDLGGWLQVLPGYSITLNRDESPASWYEVRRANIDYAVARVLLEYSNVATLTDFHWSGLGYDHYPFPSLVSQGTTLYEMVDYFARAIAHRLTCDQWGRLHVRPDPQLCDPAGGATAAARTTAVQKALTEADWSALHVTVAPFPRTNWNWESAIVAKPVDADALPQIDSVFAVAPGRAPSQGTATAQTGEQLATGQAELNARAGHRYAAHMNNPTGGVELTLAGIDDFAIQPAYLEWITLTTSAATAGQRGRVYTAARMLPAEVAIAHDAERQTQTVTIRAEAEVSGSAAATYYPPANDYGDLPGWNEEPVTPPPASDYDMGPGLSKVFLLHASGEVSITSDFQTKSVAGGPSYTVVDLSLVGTVLDAVADPYSPLYLGTGATVNAWVVTTERIYYVQDVAGVVGRVVTSQHTFASASDYRTIQTERGVRNWVIVASYYLAGGVKACRTTDGSTWTEVTVSSGIASGGAGVGPPPGTYDWAIDIDMTLPLPAGWGTVLSDHVVGVGFTKYIRQAPGGPAVSTAYTTGAGHLTYLYLHVSSWPANYGNNAGFDPYWIDINGAGLDGWYDASQLGYEHIETPAGALSSVQFAYNSEGQPSKQFIIIRRQWNDEGVNGTFTIDRIIMAGTGTAPWSGFPDWEPETTGLVTPALHVSGKAPGVAYIGAFVGGVGRLFKCTDYGAMWFQTSIPASDFGQSLGGAFHFPWHANPDERLYYWGKYVDATNTHSAYRTEADGVTKTLLPAAESYGPADPKCWSTSATNRQVMALMSTDGANVRGDRSEDGGDSFTLFMPPAARAASYTGVHIADETAVMYLWGPAGVAYTGTGGLLVDDRTGDASASEVVAIGGW